MSNKGTILFADDEERMRDLISDFLSAEGYTVLTAKDGKEAWDTFVSQVDIKLVILDVMMPHMDGYQVLKEIKKTRDVPVILLTAKTGEYDELKGFDEGVDEYIKKPFRPKILVARVNAIINRYNINTKESDKLEAFGVVINKSTHQVLCDNESIELTSKEFELLEYFIINKKIALSRDMILENVWGYDYLGDGRTVDTHVKNLRNKLKDKGSLIKTVWSFGYKFEE